MAVTSVTRRGALNRAPHLGGRKGRLALAHLQPTANVTGHWARRVALASVVSSPRPRSCRTARIRRARGVARMLPVTCRA